MIPGNPPSPPGSDPVSDPGSDPVSDPGSDPVSDPGSDPSPGPGSASSADSSSPAHSRSFSRRRFLAGAGLSLAGAAALPPLGLLEGALPGRASLRQGAAWDAPPDWEAIRALFDLDERYAHLALFFLASHPRPVREAIETMRRELDRDPVHTVERRHFGPPDEHLPTQVKTAIGDYIGGAADGVALTDSTTMSLALIYGGMILGPDDEVLTTAHDHYVHHEAARFAAERTGAGVRRVALYDDSSTATVDEMAERLGRAIRPETRVVGVTWVHSSTGVKVPLRELAEVVARANRGRAERDRALLVVDGVHGIGIEERHVARTGIDFFAAGLHKWILGPRGTGFVWGTDEAWARTRPVVPTFDSFDLFEAWAEGRAPSGPNRADRMSPGGFKAFEHYWAVPAAIELHHRIGPDEVTGRIHALNTRVKEGLADLDGVRILTPADPRVSSGITTFEVEGEGTGATVQRLLERRIIGSSSPYVPSYPRLAPGLANSEAEVDRAVAEVGRR